MVRGIRRALPGFFASPAGLALVALVGGAQWILRRKLLAPLSRIAHRVDNMRKGGGWLPVLPPTDSELAGLVQSVRELGPGLEEQVLQWVEVERRAVAATLLNSLDKSLREPRRRMMALAGDLQARDLVTPEGKAELRALNSEVDHVVEVLRLEEAARFGQRSPAAGDSSEESLQVKLRLLPPLLLVPPGFAACAPPSPR